jgi:hypothetical protein
MTRLLDFKGWRSGYEEGEKWDDGDRDGDLKGSCWTVRIAARQPGQKIFTDAV